MWENLDYSFLLFIFISCCCSMDEYFRSFKREFEDLDRYVDLLLEDDEDLDPYVNLLLEGDTDREDKEGELLNICQQWKI